MANYSSENSNRPDGDSKRCNEFSNAPFNEYRGYTPALGIDLREAAGMSVPLIVFTWLIWAPLGILLTILKLVGSKQKEEAARWMRQYGADNGSAAGRPYSQAGVGSLTGVAASLRKKTAKINTKSNKGNGFWPQLLFWAGLVALFVGLASLSEVISSVYYIISYGFNLYDFLDVFSNLGWMLSGAVMLFASHGLKKRNRLWKKMKAIVGERDYMSVEEISCALPASYKETTKALESAIDRGEFGPSAYLDMRSKSLVVRGAAPAPQEKEAKPAKKASALDAQSQNQYSDILRQLRAANEAIPGKEMSAKIDRLETVTAKIFQLAEKNPEKLPQLRRFMDYYLPTALKLLNSYAQFDSQGVDGAIITDSKKKIEETMDTLVVGFEQQLDKLFQDDALDVSADISVLKNMMAQDGLNQEESPFSTGNLS